MSNATIRLLFAGAVTLGGLVGDMTVIVVGMVAGLDIVEIVALASLPNAALIAGMAFFFGHVQMNGLNGKKHQ